MSFEEIDDGSGNGALQPLLRWAEPLYAPARERVLRRWDETARRHPRHFDGERLARSIRAAFAGSALEWSGRALLLELAIARHQETLQGETPEQRFAHFLDWIDSAAGRSVIEARYPPLPEDIVRLAAQTEQFLGRFLQRMTHDFPKLSPLFAAPPGRLSHFSLGQGDRHDHGGSVVKLGFEHGRALYKPRSLAMDEAFAGLVAVLAAHGVEPAQKATVSVNCGAYGYAAWIDHAPVPDAAAVTRYYARYGGLVALAYLLNCSDLHLENLIAHGEYPVLIDLETVFQPWISRYGRGERKGIPYAPSILVSGLLPGQMSNMDAWDMSGLAWQEHRYQTRLAAGAGTDQLRLAPGEATMLANPNVPRYADGRRIPSHDYAEAIVQGFETTYRGLHRIKPMLRDERGPLASFARLETRTVLRSTQIYARLLDAMAHPQYLRSLDEREAVVARLEVGGRTWAALRRVQPAEREALLRGDVPRFTARVDATAVHDGDGHVITRLCERSGWSEVQRRVRNLSPIDMHRQRYALTQSLECDDVSNALDAKQRDAPKIAAARPYRGRSFLATAVALGDDLLRLSFRGNDGIIFFQPEYRDSDKPSVSAMGLAFYEGLLGVLPMLAELGLHSGLKRFTRAAEAALNTSRRALQDDPKALLSIGPYGGLSGWIYVLLLLGKRWGRDDLLDEAAAWLPRVAERIGEDDSLDLIDGAAGCLLVLLELQRERPSEAVLAAAAACAARLAEKAQHDATGAYWIGAASDDEGLTGFAHGTAGIVAALLRHGQQVGDETSLALAAEALRYERAAFVARGRRWYDRYASPEDGETGTDVVSWCHGASGMGLARLLWPQALHDSEWRTELTSCIASVRKQPPEASQTLCHGRLGDLDLLLQFATREGDATALAECRELGKKALETARTGWIHGGGTIAQEPLGLMIGLAGLAYGCLRLHDPVATPAVLSLSTSGLPSTIV